MPQFYGPVCQKSENLLNENFQSSLAPVASDIITRNCKKTPENRAACSVACILLADAGSHSVKHRTGQGTRTGCVLPAWIPVTSSPHLVYREGYSFHLQKLPKKTCYSRILLAKMSSTNLFSFIFIFFCFILFYFILFYFILFYFILFYFILFFFYFILFYFILICFIFFYFVLFFS